MLMPPYNTEVTKFLDDQQHPLRKEIEALRAILINAHKGITENIKWNGPNYCHNNEDRITMKIQPPKQIQLIFHRGAKVKQQPADRLIKDTSNLLAWKENDRAVASFKSMADIDANAATLKKIVKDWIEATTTATSP
jgi:hypothetical protein